MKLIKPSFTIIEQGSGIEGVYKQIEMAGRTCYKSEDKITETSAIDFVDRMIKSGHGAMLEHGTVYLTIPYAPLNSVSGPERKYRYNKYSKITCDETPKHGVAYVTTNLRVLVENNWMDDLKYLSMPTENHARRITVKFILDNGIMREFTRHRVFSFACESTRYCNYSKSKFNSNVTYIIPCWSNLKECEINTSDGFDFAANEELVGFLGKAEQNYFYLLNKGWKPQQARNILPLATKCELVMTGFVDDWKHFFHLRTAAGAHPQARELAQPLEQEFINKRYI